MGCPGAVRAPLLQTSAGCGRLKIEIYTNVFSVEMKAGLGQYKIYPSCAFLFIFSAMEVSRCK